MRSSDTMPTRWPGTLRVLHETLMAAASVAAPVLLYWQAQVPEHEAEAVAPFFNRADLAILLIFCVDVAARFALARDKRKRLPFLAIDLIVLFPLVQLRDGVASARWFFLVRQAALLLALAWRASPVRALARLLYARPARALVISFALAILLGALLLALPTATTNRKGLSLLDAVFTTTSATCVTGLTVCDTGADLTIFGQVVVLVLIQAGGLGIMTFSVSLVLLSGGVLGGQERLLMHDVMDEDAIQGIMDRVRFIVRSVLLIEGLGAMLLWTHWLSRWPGSQEIGPVMRLYFAVFHSVSAFCNAGFSLWSNNLEGFAADWATLGTIMALIVLGGLGFVVLGDLAGLARRRRPKGQGRRLRLQSRVVLRMTFALIALGAAALYIAEHKGVLASISPSERAAVCLFQSVTARTAGFNTVPIGSLTPAALFAIILLMYVGASPNSTGGGIKTTTFWTMLRLALAALKSRPRIQSDLREVPLAVVQKAIHVMVGYTLVLVLGVFALLVSEARPGAPGGGPFSFLELLFEATSALGTVGLSCGITPKLSATGKLILIGLMFAGRVGPLTLALSVVRRPEPQRVRYPEERVMIG